MPSKSTFVLRWVSAVSMSLVLTTLGLAASATASQEPASKPETPAPTPTQTAPSPSATAPTAAPATTASGHPANAYWTAHDKQLLSDVGWLARYKDVNEKLPKPAPDEKRVVFMGDSITEGWHFDGPDGSFPTKPYLNRGISGQT